MRPTASLLALLAVFLCAGCDTRHKPKSGAAVSGASAVGRMLIQPVGAADAAAGDAVIEEQLRKLNGEPLRRQAEEALLKRNPSLKVAAVSVQTVRAPGSSSVSVVGHGSDVEAAKALVDQIMDLYAESMKIKDPSKEEKDLDPASIEKELSESEAAWNAVRLEHEPARIETDLAAHDRRVKGLEAARAFCRQELDVSGKLSLEDDIRRRQQSSSLPADIPAEFASLLRTAPTSNETAYLNSLKQTNKVAIEAAKEEAEKDSKSRAEALRKQIEVIDDLTRSSATERAKFVAKQELVKKAEARFHAAEARYKDLRERRQASASGLASGVSAMVSITEHAGSVGGH